MNIRTIRLSLRNKLAAGFALLSLLVAAVTTRGFYVNLVQQTKNEFRQRVLSIVQVAALQQNGDELLQISSGEDELYEKYRLQNLKIRYADPDIIYVYTMRRDARGIYFVVDAGEPGEEGIAEFGEVYEEPSTMLVENFESMNQAIVESEIYTDEWGSFLSAYAPIYSSTGQNVGVIAVDIHANTVLAKERQILFQSLAILAVAVLLGSLLGYLSGFYLAQPIRNMVAGTKAFANGNLEARVNISTRDEIEELGHTFNNMAAQIQELVINLENHVEQRTHELAVSASHNQKRAEQLKVISEVSNSIASLQGIEKLLPLVSDTISRSFGFYHVGIFLLDEEKENAVLQAANSEGGQRMLARKHRLRIGQEGIVGYTIAQREARIALDVGQDSVFFDNPDLPATRSEMALPLMIGGEVIGALDVQSEQSDAFSSEDIEVLGTLANQVAIAIENSRLFQKSQDTLKELDSTFQHYIKTEWQQFTAKSKVVGYRANESGLEPITEEQIAHKSQNNDHRIQTVPIMLRGALLGSLNIDLGVRPSKSIEEEQNLIRTIADRLALALESARLLDESQRAAAKEQAIGAITGKIGSSINLRNVLQTAVEELGRNIPGAEVVIELTSKKDKDDSIFSGEIK